MSSFAPGQDGFDLLGSEHEVEELIGCRVEFGGEVHRSIRDRSRALGPFVTERDDSVYLEHILAMSVLLELTARPGLGARR